MDRHRTPTYKGWTCGYNRIGDRAGRWTAHRFGVRLTANNEAEIRVLIDQYEKDRANWIAQRKEGK